MSTTRHENIDRKRGSSLSADLLAALAVCTLVIGGPAAQAAPGGGPLDTPRVYRGAEVFGPFAPSEFDGDLRALPAPVAWQPGDPIKEIPRRTTAWLAPVQPQHPVIRDLDPLAALQASVGSEGAQRAFTTPLLNIVGQGYTGVAPPDPNGDIGINYYIHAINSGGGSNIAVYDKGSGGLVSSFVLDSLGSGNCGSGGGDPIVLYDELADRWLLSEFPGGFGSNRLCVYISKVPGDPVTGGWWNYQFNATNFPDYPKYGVWPDAYYVSSNENDPAAYALERDQMLDGLPATAIRRTVPDLNGFGFQTLTPAEHDGTAAPPAGAPNFYMRHRDDESHNANNDPTRDFVEIWQFSVDFDNPANTTLTGPFNIAVSEFDSNTCGLIAFSCVPQPGFQDLDPLREPVMWRLQYRNFGSYETLVGNFMTDVAVNQHAVRWFELRRSGGGAWALYQEGTFAPNNIHRWMGSIAMDASGNIALGYNVSSNSLNPGLRYTGRLDTDTLGIMTQGDNNLVAGTGSSPTNRYGDYSAMVVDPVDGCSFWFTGEYSLGNGTWATRIGKLRFDDCSDLGGPDPSLAVSGVCPGPTSIDVTSLTPHANLTIYSGSGFGSGTLATGACAGLEVGITNPVERRTFLADAAGNFSANPDIQNPGTCGTPVVFVDESRCAATNADALP